MRVHSSTITIKGAALSGVNPLPMFRNREHHRVVNDNGTLLPEQRIKIGYETGERMLPYQMQDRYSRERKNLILKTITLENDILKAVFLPEYGGRLYSLVDKRTNKEILYRNPVFQPGNLAILNAWFSGGVEWNVGQVGHTFTTCSPVHAVKLVDDEGNEFLRIYEYERCKNVFWHIDFHLPPHAEELQIYVRIVNDQAESVPMYWWTNIAVQETPQARVFSSTSEVIYIDHHVKGFGLGELPHLPTVPDVDVTYPLKFPFSNEYFFQTRESLGSPWEAVAYEDGRLFYERSTARLRYRKMFCWGHHPGGRRWCDFLADPAEGDYIEIQGGFSPTQMHGQDMPANTVWDFTQMMGMTHVDTDQVYVSDWSDANQYVAGSVDELLTEDKVYETHRRLSVYAEKMPTETLFQGSGWGALERLRREYKGEHTVPAGFVFGDETLTAAQAPWVELLQTGQLPKSDVHDIPASWMVQSDWKELVQDSLKEQSSWYALLHYGVMLYEAGEEEEAVTAWKASIEAAPSVWTYRNLAVAAKQAGNSSLTLHYMEEAYALAHHFPDRAFAEEYLGLLVERKDYARAWDVFQSLPETFAQSDRVQIIIGEAALTLDKDDFLTNLFQKEFAVIREGEVTIVELWYKVHAKQLAEHRGVPLTDELLQEARILYPPPANIDFRIIGS